MISLPLFVSLLMAPKGGVFNPQRFYMDFSMAMVWSLLIHYWYVWKKARSARKNKNCFWLDEKEIEFVEKTYGDGRPLDEYYAALPLARRRLATICHGFLGALPPAGLAWSLTAAAGKLFLSKPLQALLVSAAGIGIYRGVVTVTLANMAALVVGLPLYRKYRDRADRKLPLPPRVTLENLRDDQGRSQQ